jgi:hypothetical protein
MRFALFQSLGPPLAFTAGSLRGLMKSHRKMVCDKLNASNVAVSDYFALDVWDYNFS